MEAKVFDARESSLRHTTYPRVKHTTFRAGIRGLIGNTTMDPALTNIRRHADASRDKYRKYRTQTIAQNSLSSQTDAGTDPAQMTNIWISIRAMWNSGHSLMTSFPDPNVILPWYCCFLYEILETRQRLAAECKNSTGYTRVQYDYHTG